MNTKTKKILLICLLSLLGLLAGIILYKKAEQKKQEKLSTVQNNSLYREYIKKLDSNIYDKAKLKDEVEVFYKTALQKKDSLWLAAAYYYKGTIKKDSAFFYLTQSQMYVNRDSILASSKIDYEIGKFYFGKKDYSKSLEYLLRAEKTFSDTKFLKGQGHVNNILGSVYSAIDEYDKAEVYYDKAISYFKQINDTLGEVISRANKSKFIKEYDLARTDLLKALSVFEKLGDTKQSISILVSLSDTELHAQNLEASLAYTDQAYTTALQIKDTLLEKYVLLHYAHIYESSGDYDKAIHFYEKGIEENKRGNLALKARQRLSALWRQKNNYPKAYSYMEQYYQLNDSIRGSAVKLAMERQQWESRLSEQSLENQLLKQESLIKQREYNNKLLIYILLTVSVISVLGLLYFNKAKSSRIIKLENSNLTSKVAFEKQLKELQEKEFAETLAVRARELNAINIQLLAKNQLFKAVRHILEKSSEYTTKDAVIRELWQQIDKLENQEQDWEQFRAVFEQIHPDFFQTIAQEVPSLTKTEIRICAYIKINMSNSEIATLLNIGHRSLITARSKIRKKLNLERDESLEDFLKSW